MVLEVEPIDILGSLAFFLEAVAVVGLAAIVVGYVVSAFRLGPLRGGDALFQRLVVAARDMLHTSPRRVTALARLAVIEAWRRRVYLVTVVYLVLLAFAPWFMASDSPNPAAQQLSFVLAATYWLVLAVALLVSVFSLPRDIKDRTITTVVTKPVRPVEIVLGRMLGFSLFGTLLLVVMGLVAYLFVVRNLQHTHPVAASALQRAGEETGGGLTGKTDASGGHRHEVNVWPDGAASTSVERGHWHDVQVRGQGQAARYALGGPRGLLVARIPVYGELRFVDRKGREASKGISVGKIWKYRSYLVGNSQAAGIWTFRGITPAAFPREQFVDGLPLEMAIEVFRAYQGDATSKEYGVAGSMQLRNPATGLASQRINFRVQDKGRMRSIPWTLKEHRTGRPLELMRDLVSDGRLEVSIQCLDHEQYFGIAQRDVYLHAADGSFAWNYLKGLVGTWLQMVLVVAFGVMFSTLVSTPVALLATGGVVVCSLWGTFIADVATGKKPGGGPIESLIRIITQNNTVTPLEGEFVAPVQTLDWLGLKVMNSVAAVLPDLSKFDSSQYLVQGFDIPAAVVYGQLLAALGYLAATALAGYFFLKLREVAK